MTSTEQPRQGLDWQQRLSNPVLPPDVTATPYNPETSIQELPPFEKSEKPDSEPIGANDIEVI